MRLIVEKIAFVIGHSEKDQGAKLYNDQTEYQYNSEIADGIIASYADPFIPKVKIFKRLENESHMDTCERVGAWGADIAIELHVNAHKEPVSGLESMVLRNNSFTSKYAEILNNMVSNEFVTRNRGIKQLIGGYRGFSNLWNYELNETEAFIFEPFFGNFETKCSSKFIDCKLLYSEVLNDFVKKINLQKL